MHRLLAFSSFPLLPVIRPQRSKHRLSRPLGSAFRHKADRRSGRGGRGGLVQADILEPEPSYQRGHRRCRSRSHSRNLNRSHLLCGRSRRGRGPPWAVVDALRFESAASLAFLFGLFLGLLLELLLGLRRRALLSCKERLERLVVVVGRIDGGSVRR